MQIGHYISGIAHTGLIGWVLLGGVFDSEPPPLEVMDVSMISSADFDALLQTQQAPDASTDVALPTPPQDNETAPQLNSESDVKPELDQPVQTAPVVPDDAPDVTELAPTPPEPDVQSDDAPVLPVPEADAGVIIPEAPVRPQTRPVDRVAPEPVAVPAPDTAISDALQEATKPDETGPAREEVVEETAPEAATTEIATEPKQDEVASAAPASSLRPRVRPKAAPTAQPDVATDAAVAAALADVAATQTAPTPTGPSGPPMTRGETDGLRVSVQQCWVVDVGSRAADVTVVVGLQLDQTGKVQGNKIELLSSEGGDAAAVNAAFQAARRAVLRCQKTGYDLPAEKYDHWREIEITFNPESMRHK